MERLHDDDDVSCEMVLRGGVEIPVLISSTTLRDGLQTASTAHVSAQDRVRIAQMEEEMGLDVTEAGYPGKVGANAVEVIEKVGQNTEKIKVAAMTGWERESIDVSMSALESAGVLMDDRGILHVLLRPSPNLMKFGYKEPISKADFLENTKGVAEYVVGRFYEQKKRGGILRVCPQIMFYLEQATESFLDDRAFFAEVQRVAVAAVYEEAQRLGYEEGEVLVKLSLCDTNGGALLDDYPSMFSYSKRNMDSLGYEVILSAHTHNDIGMAVVNAVNAVLYGAGQVEVTACGIGEAAGNAQVAAVVASLDLLNEKKGFNFTMGVDRSAITDHERFVMNVIGEPISPRMPITGWQVSHDATTAGLHSSAQENANREAGLLSQKTGEEVAPVLVYRALDTSLYGNDGEVFLGSEQGIDALRRGLDKLHVYVGPDLEKKLFERMRDGYKKARNLEEYLREVLMTPWFVRELRAEESLLNVVRVEVRDLKINIHGVSDLDGNNQQHESHEVEMKIALWGGGEDSEIIERKASSTGGPMAAASQILSEITSIKFNVEGYFERIAGDDDGGVSSDGASAPTVATFLICDLQERKRRGFGMDRDSNESKIEALVQAVNRLYWQRDAKNKAVPPIV
jgi:2-isopropylmalate synthase